MKKIENIKNEKKRVIKDVDTLLLNVRSIVKDTSQSAAKKVDLLVRLRAVAYEELNQLLHEYLILAAAKWLTKEYKVPSNVAWYWNPRQTGDANEPDLWAKVGKKAVSAEITTAREPRGTARPNGTLKKLNGFQGKRFYVVLTERMEKRANAIVTEKGWKIVVKRLDLSEAI